MTFKPYDGPTTPEETRILLDFAVPGFGPAASAEKVGFPRINRMCREIRCVQRDHRTVSMFVVRWAKCPSVRICNKCSHRILDLMELVPPKQI